MWDETEIAMNKRLPLLKEFVDFINQEKVEVRDNDNFFAGGSGRSEGDVKECLWMAKVKKLKRK